MFYSRPAPSKEFLFVAACCVWPPDGARARTAAPEPLDWQRVMRLSALHRVDGLVNNALLEVGAPAEAKREFAARAGALARGNLELAAEALRLERLFTEASMPVLFLKGLTLAVLAYANLGLRHGKDIDLLVAPESAAAATKLIERAGYRRHDPPPDLSERQVQSLYGLRKDSSFYRQDGAFEVELHWRLLDNPYLMPSIAVPLQHVPIGSQMTLTTLGDDDLFAYLCAHGANHCWYRLKWLADIGALIASKSPNEIVRLHAAAETRGAGPATAQALLLCHRLLGTPVPDALLERLRGSIRARWLERIALWAVTSGKEQVVPPELPFGPTRITFSHYLLRSNWRYWLKELRIQLTSTRDMQMLPLPTQLIFFYPLLRVPLWLCRRLAGRAH